MGQTLSSPATKKTSEVGVNGRFMYAVSEMQGWRISMEDAHAAVLDLDEGSEGSNTFFAIYDGHGGSTVARFAGQNVHKRLVSDETYREKQYEAALKRAFLGTDEDLLANPGHTKDPSGCTAVAALITHDGRIYVANAGDSRSVISIKGGVKPLSFDHKPSNEGEMSRISGAGGYVECGRVNGNLALSRALGDFDFKKNYALSPEKQMITADPEVTCHQITDEDEFLILACDGIWDCLTSQQAVDIVRYRVSEGMELKDIAEMICDHCLAPDTSSGLGVGCDNMTIMIVALLHERTREEWYTWIADRVKNEYGYPTPAYLPQLYSPSRLMSFRARTEAQEARERAREVDDGGGLRLTKVLGSTGGISFRTDSNIMMNDTPLMFGNDDDDSDEEFIADSGQSFFSESLGSERPTTDATTQSLKDRVMELEKALENDTYEVDVDSLIPDADDRSNSPTPVLQGEAPPPPRSLPNGITISVEQLKPLPMGDEPSPVFKEEGFLDKSEGLLQM